MPSKNEYGTTRELNEKFKRFERAPAQERRQGLTITEQEVKIIAPFIERHKELQEKYSRPMFGPA